jgi:hypothetical protein
MSHPDPNAVPDRTPIVVGFSDVVVFRSPPPAVQRLLFGVLAPVARWRGYHATYPQLSRIRLAPRT